MPNDFVPGGADAVLLGVIAHKLRQDALQGGLFICLSYSFHGKAK